MTSGNESLSADVVISGGGPVGLALAIDLGQRGVSCIVVERHDEPQRVPKGQNLTPRTMEHFRAWNCEAELRAARTTPRATGSEGLTAYGSLLGDFHYDWLNRKLVRPYYAADNERLPQYCTEAVLRERVSRLDRVRFLTGWSVAGLTETGDGVSFDIERREGGDRRQVRGRYAVGADGSRSRVRELSGLTQTLFDHDRQMMLLVFHSPELSKLLLDRFPGKSFFNVLHPDYEGYWLFLGRVDSRDNFFFHAPMDRDADPARFDYHRFVEAAIGARFDATIEYRGFWDCRVSIADSYGKGRVFIAGDAAHSHPPYGGYGINTGFEDARNLGWKLEATLKGWAGPGLLGTYDGERRPVFWSTAKDFIEASIERDRDFLAAYHPDRDRAAFEAEWNRRAGDALTEVLTFQPNYRGSAIVFGTGDGRIDAVSSHEHRARGGYHLAPRMLADGRNVFDLLGSGFTLIALSDDDGEMGRWRAQAEALGIPLDIVVAEPGGEALDYGAALVLVRPDQFVAWAGEPGSADPADVLGRVIGP